MSQKKSSWIIILVLLCTGTIRCEAGLVGYWPLDEQSDGQWVDHSGHAFHGKQKGRLAWVKSQEDNRKRPRFIGRRGHHIEVPPLNLNSNRVTISAWIKPERFMGKVRGIVFCRSDKSAAGIHIQKGVLGYHWNNRHWNWQSGLQLVLNQWTHVVLVVNPDKAILYLNTDGVMTSSTNTAKHDIEAFNAVLAIGADPIPTAGWNRNYQGMIRDVLVFDHALDEVDIVELYALGSDTYLSPSLTRLADATREALRLGKKKAQQHAADYLTKQFIF